MAEIERFITVDTWPPQPSSDGEWVRHSDHLAVVEEQAKTIKHERTKKTVGLAHD